ncbi:hypothetical protein EE612_056773, partial [Oryza sativa]
AAGLVSINKNSLVSFALPLIEAGKLWKVLDRRPAAEPPPRQLQATDAGGGDGGVAALVEKPSFVGRPISTIVPDAIKSGAKDDL